MSNLPILFVLILLSIGIAGLVWTADRFIAGAAAMAEDLGISPLVIGLTIVSIGTSAPEILVSATAAVRDVGSLAVGNALGSNLANIGLVLGVTCLFFRIPVTTQVLRKEMLIMILVTLGIGLVLIDSYLGRYESLVLVTGLVIFVWATLRSSKSGEPIIPVDNEIEEHMPLPKAVALTCASLIGLLLFANLLVGSASELALRMGISEIIIGMTAVAVGTSLPELAASIAGCRRGKTDIALGNVLGSNIFNLLAVLPVVGLIRPFQIEDIHLVRDYGILLGLSVLLGLFCFVSIGKSSECQLGKKTGGIFLAIYCLYYYLVFAL